MSEPVLDAEAIEEAEVVEPVEHAPTMAVARRERRSEVIRPLDTDALVQSFSEYQDLLPRLLSNEDYQSAGRGKRFVKKSGWRKIATAFDLDVQILRSIVERDDHGQPERAEVWARAIAPSGRAMDGDGYCSVDEERFSGPRGNKTKLENDLRATATTRAMNRAISGLVGMGEVSAEEMDATGDKTPAWAAPATDEAKKNAVAALAAVIGDRPTAIQYMKLLAEGAGGALPATVAAWITTLPDWIAAAQTVEPEPVDVVDQGTLEDAA